MSTTTYSRPLSARREGTCPACGDEIQVGDQITRGANVRGYVHVGCVDFEPEAREVTVSEPGVYETDGVVYIVKPTRAEYQGQPVSERRLYAKRIVEIGGTRSTEAGTFVAVDFEYAPGAIFSIRPEDRMDFDRARELTVRYGRCICCGRHLKAAESVEQGIGPVCVRMFPGREAERKAIASRARAEARAAGTPPIAGAAPTLSEMAARIEGKPESELREEHSREVYKASAHVPGADPDRTYKAIRERQGARLYFRVPLAGAGGYGPEFETYDGAAAEARSSIREIDGCPGQLTRAFVDRRVSDGSGDRSIEMTEVFRLEPEYRHPIDRDVEGVREPLGKSIAAGLEAGTVSTDEASELMRVWADLIAGYER